MRLGSATLGSVCVVVLFAKLGDRFAKDKIYTSTLGS